MIRIFEAFAGYGSQRMALRNLGIPFEVVGISEIDGDVLLSYAAVHNGLIDKIHEAISLSNEDMYLFLEKLNVPLNYKSFKNNARSLKGQKLKNMYLANKLSKNFGDIRNINPCEIPDFDILTYSFPCQDISIAGFQNGLSKGSGTRSSLLWECCKIISHKKPKYLIMENVKNLISKNHKSDFDKFLLFLESLGYRNYWSLLDAKDYGIPQSRSRLFCVSVLDDDRKFVFPEPLSLNKRVEDLLELDVPMKFYLDDSQTCDFPIVQKYIYCLDSNYWKGTFLKDFLEKKRRQLVTSIKRNDGKYTVRRLTPLETWRFMGCNDEDFTKAEKFVSNTSLYKQSGNSIVVPVLEELFKKLISIYELEGEKHGL